MQTSIKRYQSILVVDDNATDATIIAKALSDDYAVHCCKDAFSAIALCLDNEFDLILMDVGLEGRNGIYAAQVIMRQSINKLTPIIFVTANTDPAVEEQCWLEGAADYIRKPFDVKFLRFRIHAHMNARRYVNHLRHSSSVDELTKLANRRYFTTHLSVKLREFAYRGQNCGVLFIDIDYFKLVNDEYGHAVGDQCLLLLAHAIKREITRAEDVVARIGGEEFAAVFDDVDAVNLALVADRIHGHIQAMATSPDFPLKQPMTVSIGGTIVQKSDTPNSVLGRADKMMYIAKTEGRNTTVIDRELD